MVIALEHTLPGPLTSNSKSTLHGKSTISGAPLAHKYHRTALRGERELVNSDTCNP